MRLNGWGKAGKGFRKAAAVLAMVTFSWSQIVYAGGAELLEPRSAVPVHAAQPTVYPANEISRVQAPGTSSQFLEGESPLSPVISTTPQGLQKPAEGRRNPDFQKRDLSSQKTLLEMTPSYDDDRYSFEDALELLRPEYASAAVIQSLTAENLRALNHLSFETGIAVIAGEIVVFTSGNEGEIRTLQPALELLEGADFISHVHVDRDEQAGPSDFDLLAAVDSPREEYVITRNGIYGYNRSGIQNQGKTYSYEEYLKRLSEAQTSFLSSPGLTGESEDSRFHGNDKTQAVARAKLNEFIRQTDLYNAGPEETRISFRHSDPVAFNETNGLFVIEAEHPYENVPRSKTWESRTAAAGFSGAGYFFAGQDSGKSYDYPDAVTKSPELKYAVNIQTPGTYYVWMRALAVDGGGDSVHVGLDGTRSDSSDRMYMPSTNYGAFGWMNKTMEGPAAVLNIPSAGLHTVHVLMREDGFSFDKMILTRDSGFIPQGTGPGESPQGNQNPPQPPASPVVNTLPAYTNQTSLTLSGTKEAGASVWINGAQAVAASSSTAWSAGVTLDLEQLHTFNITAKNAAGLSSSAVNASVTYDKTAPVIQVLSADNASSAQYTLVYQADGIRKERIETLVSGQNTLRISETDAAGNLAQKDFIVICNPPAPPPVVSASLMYMESGGAIVIEAEHASENVTRSKTWESRTAAAGFSGSGYFFAGQDSGKSYDYPDALNKSPELKYAVNIQTPGIYYVWLRGLAPNSAGDSIHVGWDGVQAASADRIYMPASNFNSFTWTNKTMDGPAASINVLTAGTHALSVLMREDGFSFDKVLLTRDPDFIPAAEGPAESLKGRILEDGTRLFYQDNRIVREEMPDGSQAIYRPDETLESFVKAGGEKIVYPDTSHDPAGIFQAVLARNPSAIAIYDEQGTLKETIPPVPAGLAGLADLSKALRVTLENGMEAFYLNGQGQPVEFRTATGIRITEFTLDSAGQIQDALILYPDGKKEWIRGSVILRREDSDGTITDFTPAGFAVRQRVNGIFRYFSYDKRSQAGVLETRQFTLAGESAVYDELGILRKASDTGKHFIYDRTAEGSGFKTTLNTALSSAPAEKTLLESHYTAGGSPVKMAMNDGSQVFLTDGRIVKSLDAAGLEADYTWQEGSGILPELRIQRGGTAFQYSNTGFLKSIQTEGGTIQRSLTDPQVIDLLLETTGGDRLSDFELDAEGKILNGIITTREGIRQTIENGALTGFQTVDGRVYRYADQQAFLTEWQMGDGSKAVFGGGQITEILFPDGRRLNQIGFTAEKKLETFTEEMPDGTRRIYRGDVMTELLTPSGAHIFYGADGMAERVVTAETGESRISYSHDAAGLIKDITFESAGIRRTYLPGGAEGGELVSILAGGVHAQITRGEISKLSTRFAEIDAPSFDAQGILSGEIRFSDGTRQMVENGKLVRTLRPDGSIVYYEQGKISAVETATGHYELIYAENAAGDLTQAKIRLASEQGSPEYPLIPYLLNPRELQMAPYYRDDSLTMGGGAALNSSRSRFGSSSVLFDGSGDYLQIPEGSSTDFQYGTGDFSVDFWFYLDAPPAGEQKLWSQYTAGSGTNAISIYIHNGKINAHTETGGQFWGGPMAGTTELQAGQWYHTALVRSGSSLKLYLNGRAESSVAVSGAAPAGNFYVSAGAGMSGGGWYSFFKGSMDEIRVTKGTALWTADFTIPLRESVRNENTVRLYHFLTEADHPEADAKLQQILLGRGNQNLLESPLELESQISVDGNSREELLRLAKWSEDPERGRVYEFSGNYSPVWSGLNGGPQDLSQGYVSRSLVFDIADNLPALAADLVDINGDGLPDRVSMPYSQTDSFWWVQMNNGAGFDAPVQWTGVERNYDRDISAIYGASQGALRFYEGRHPHVLGEFLDINGDGLPDRVLQKFNGTPDWYVQINNGHGFEPVKIWTSNVHPLSQWSNQASYATRVREDGGGKSVQELIADLVDMDGDGLTDRVLRPYTAPYDHWFFQRNNGLGFEDAVLWQGVDASFDADAKTGGALSWYKDDNGILGDLSSLLDMNGDRRADRVLLKLKNPADEYSGYNWYVQFNNGSGFDDAVLWSSNVRNVPGYGQKTGTAIRFFDYASGQVGRSMFADLVDVTGDGLPDRVSVNSYSTTQSASSIWWVEINTGSGFLPAVQWTGIEGSSAAETSLGQDDSHYRSFGAPGFGREPGGTVQHITTLQDLNGDKIPDRVIFREQDGKWRVQYGTGSGFLPAREMTIEAMESPSVEIPTSRYSHLHVSLRANSSVTPAQGQVRVILGESTDPENDTIVQEWTIQNLTADWQDFYLPVDPGKANASRVRIEFVPAPGSQTAAPVLYADNMTFLALRPEASKDWLDRVLTEENILSEIHSGKTQTLAQDLGYVESGKKGTDNHSLPAPFLDWNKLLSAESKIQFNPAGEAAGFETLYGTVSKVENGHVTESTLADGSVITFSAPGTTASQTLTNTDGSAQNLQLTYGRVREVSRPGKASLQYSYEFTGPAGTEIRIVLDPETGVTERSLGNQLISRTDASGVVTSFDYDSKGEVIRSTISYGGRVRQVFEHVSAESGKKIILHEDGSREEFGLDGRITAHTTTGGYRYLHTYEKAKKAITTFETHSVQYADGSTASFDVPVVALVEAPDGEDIQRISLSGYDTAGGEHAGYENGALKNLILADGKTRIDFERIETVEIFNAESQSTIPETRLLDAIVFHADGTITEFKNGKPHSVTNANGRVISLETDPEMTNPDESAAFHHAQALKLWAETIHKKWMALQLPPELPVETELSTEVGSGERVLTRRFAEGVIELYGDNGKIEQVVSPEGEVLVEYFYEGAGEDPVRIEMGGARRRLESAAKKLRAEVAVEREKALAKVADREAVLNQTIEGQYVASRERLIAIRAQIEAQAGQMASIQVKGKQARALIGGVMGQIQAGLDQVNGAIESLANQRSEALKKLASQVAEVSLDIESQTRDSYAQIETQNGQARASILRQEISPVVYHWYRKILGRDPSRAEYDEVIAQVSFDFPSPLQGEGQGEGMPAWLVNLKNRLETSAELAARTAQVAAIKARVSDQLRAYLTFSTADKRAFAENLGISASSGMTNPSSPNGLIGDLLVNLTSAQIESILSWLNTRSLHFGQSAFLALEALLAASLPLPAGEGWGEGERRIELATRLILIDILTGTITPLEGAAVSDSSDLVISMYALEKAGASYGLPSAAGYKMNYAALREMYVDACGLQPEACGFRAIAHINGNHYVILTEVTDTDVTYIDPGLGPEEALDQVTLSKADFLAAWINPQYSKTGLGYILSSFTPPAASLIPETGDSVCGPGHGACSRRLGSAESMSVRGAFFGFLIPLLIAVLVVSTVVGVIANINAILDSVKALLSGIGQFFKGLFTFNFSEIWEGLKQQMMGSLGLTALVLSAPVIGFGKILDWVGIPEGAVRTISNIGQIVTGVVLSPVNPAVGASLIAGGTGGLLNDHTTLSPTFKSIISLSAAAVGAFAGGGFNTGSFSGSLEGLKSVTPFLARDFATAGLVAVGNSLGFSPQLTSLLSIPLSAGIGVGVDSLTRASNINSTSIFNSIKDAFTSSQTISSLVSVGANIGLDAIGAPPLARNFVSGFLGQLAAGFSGGSSGGGSPGDSESLGQGILSKIGEGLQKFSRSVVDAVGNIISFGQKIVERASEITVQGFKKAVSAFSSIFSRQTQEGIYADETGLRQATVTANGNIWTWQNASSRIDYNTQTGEAVESFGAGGTARVTGLSQDQDGNFYYQKLNYETSVGGGATLHENYEDGRLSDWGYYYGDEAIVRVESLDGRGWQVENGWMESSDIEIRTAPIEIQGPDTDLALIPSIFDQLFLKFHILNGQIAEASVEAEAASSAQDESDLRLDQNLYVATNGIGYEADNVSSSYMENLRLDLFNQSNPRIDPIKDVIVAPAFDLSGFLKNTLNAVFGQTQAAQIIQKIKNVWDWYQTQKLGGNTDSVFDLRESIKSLANIQGVEAYARGIVGVGYSGGFAQLVHALADGEFIPKAFVALGGVTAWVGSKLAELLVNVVEGFEQFVTVRDDTVRAFTQAAVGLMSLFLKGPLGIAANAVDSLIQGLSTWYNLTDKQALDAKVAEFYQNLQLMIAPQFGYNWTSLANSNANAVVNIYGSKDPLTIGNLISGHLDELGGYSPANSEKSLFNIEIKGANHYDYINGVYDYTDPQDIARNKIISKFVAQVILNSESADKLQAFLSSTSSEANITRPDFSTFNYVIDFGF